MRKPGSLWQFERVLALATLIELFNQIITLRHAKKVLSDPVLAEIGLGIGTYIGISIAGVGFALLVWFYIVRRASKAARIGFTGLVVLAVFQLATNFSTSLSLPPATQFVRIASLSVQVYAVWLLYRPDSRAWFAKGIGRAPAPQRHSDRYRD